MTEKAENGSIEFEIHDLSAFTSQREAALKPGDVFFNQTGISMIGVLNGQGIHRAQLSGAYVIVQDDLYKPRDRNVGLLTGGFKRRVHPIGAGFPAAMDIDLRNTLVVTEMGLGLCGNFSNDPLKGRELGRIVIVLEGAEIFFHQDELTFIFPSWEIAWVDQHNVPVLSIRRTA